MKNEADALVERLRPKLMECLRFAASRSVISSAEEQAIIGAFSLAAPLPVSLPAGVRQQLERIIKIDQREKRHCIDADPAGSTYEVTEIDGPCAEIARSLLAARPIPEAQGVEAHPDDLAVDRFASAMKAKLAQNRGHGRSGWEHCTAEHLSTLLRDHVEKGDPLDVGNLAMMLHQNGQSIVAQPASDAAPTTEPVEAQGDGWIEWRQDVPFADKARIKDFEVRLTDGRVLWANVIWNWKEVVAYRRITPEAGKGGE